MADNQLRYINFDTIFHPYTARLFVEAFDEIHDSDQPIIPIQINSPGGYVIGLQTCLDRIDASEKKIATFVTGMACSCGAAMAMAGSDGLRFISNNAEFMIHQVSGGARGKASDIEAESKLMNKMLDKFVYHKCDKAAKKESGYTRNLIKENFNADLSMFADEAIEHGFFDGIGTISMIKNMDDLLKRCNPEE